MPPTPTFDSRDKASFGPVATAMDLVDSDDSESDLFSPDEFQTSTTAAMNLVDSDDSESDLFSPNEFQSRRATPYPTICYT